MQGAGNEKQKRMEDRGGAARSAAADGRPDRRGFGGGAGRRDKRTVRCGARGDPLPDPGHTVSEDRRRRGVRARGDPRVHPRRGGRRGTETDPRRGRIRDPDRVRRGAGRRGTGGRFGRFRRRASPGRPDRFGRRSESRDGAGSLRRGGEGGGAPTHALGSAGRGDDHGHGHARLLRRRDPAARDLRPRQRGGDRDGDLRRPRDRGVRRARTRDRGRQDGEADPLKTRHRDRGDP